MGHGASAGAEDAATLHARRDMLTQRRAALERELEHAEAGERDGASKPPAPAHDSDAAPAGAVPDSLEEFMGSIASRLDVDRITTLRRDLDGVQVDLAHTERLIAVADPEGYFAGGSRAAVDAISYARQALETQQTKAAAAAARARARQVCRERRVGLKDSTGK